MVILPGRYTRVRQIFVPEGLNIKNSHGYLSESRTLQKRIALPPGQGYSPIILPVEHNLSVFGGFLACILMLC